LDDEKEETMERRIKKSLTYVIFATILMISFLILQPVANAVEEVKIGAIFALSGSVAPIGRSVKQALDLAVKELNREGGIKSLGGAKVKMVYADSRGDAKIGLSEAERLILQDKVAAIVGAHQSSVTMTSTQVAEKYKVPYLATIAVSDQITARGFKYVFRANENATMAAKELLAFLDRMGKSTGKPIKTLGFLYENTEWGQNSAKAWHKYAKDYGFQVILDEPYPSTTTDITPVILKFKQQNPDAVVNASYISDIILIVKTMAEQKWVPKAFISGGGGELEPDFIKAVGNLADDNYTYLPFPPDILLSPNFAWAKPMAEEFKKDYGVEISGDAGEAYGIFWVLVDALQRAGSADRDKIRDALAKTNITEESAKGNLFHRRALLLPYKQIAFGPDGQNPHVRIPICQFQDKVIRTVYPPEIVAPGIKPVWPARPWDQRK
jgi:branched-chain amino acid transport system substrate-binding protein